MVLGRKEQELGRSCDGEVGGEERWEETEPMENISL